MSSYTMGRRALLGGAAATMAWLASGRGRADRIMTAEPAPTRFVVFFTPNGTVITPMSDWRPTSWPATPGPVHIVGVPEGEVLPLTPSKPKFDRTFWIASGLWGAASTADIITTHKALERGAVEQNPIFARRNGHAVRYTANAIASAGIWGVAAYAEHRGHRRVARVLLFTGAAIRIGAAFWNNSRRR